MRTMRMEREDIENSLKVLSHIVEDDFIITVDEARKIIGIDGETIEALQAQLPKRGEWIMCESEKPYIVCKCSVCGGLTSEGGHYCPNCGARMIGEHDGNAV